MEELENFSESLLSSISKLLYQFPPALLLAISVAAFAIYFAARYLFRLRRKTADRRRQIRIMKGISPYVFEDVIIEDGVEGEVTVDYCVLTPGGVLVLNVQNYPGVLFGADNIDLWTQLYQHKSYKFRNPLPYNQYCVQAIKSFFPPSLPVVGRVVFTSAGEFPKGIPESVSMLDQLHQDIEYMLDGEVDADVVEAWEELRQQAGLNKKGQPQKKIKVTEVDSRYAHL
ncbi:MAG: NERD domain-containing protein [Gammaproteobacteria bacterium]|nr:NERD domain-containing protein [Gammaproteobacteria bacterium]